MKFIPDAVFLALVAEQKIDLRSREGRRSARLLFNELAGARFTGSELIGGSLLVFYTANRMQSREFHLPA